jgi:hypothetical protein
MGLMDSREACTRILECGGLELCVSLLCHPWFEVSYSALLLLKKVFSERYMQPAGKLLIDQLLQPRRKDVPWLGVVFGPGFELRGPDMTMLLTSCEAFLRVHDDLAVRMRDPRAEIAFRLLANLANDRRCRVRLEAMDAWKDNLINEVLEQYTNKVLAKQGLPIIGSYPKAYIEDPYKVTMDRLNRRADYLPESQLINQNTKLRKCALRSCSKVEPEADTFHLCKRCKLIAFCCSLHEKLVWSSWHYKGCVSASKTKLLSK